MNIEATADYLLDLRSRNIRAATLPEALRPRGLKDAYAAQGALVARLCAAHGSGPVGYKIALTSVTAQSLVGVAHPVSGRLLGHAVHPTGAVLPAAQFGTCIVEVEFGFRIGRDLVPGPGPVSHERLLTHVDTLLPSLEIVDHHFAALDAMPVEALIADNAIHGAWIHGEPASAWRDLDLAAVETALWVNGAQALSGAGDRTLGSPLSALSWLVHELAARGEYLHSGDLVTTGLTTDGIHDARSGETLRATFGDLGEVSAQFA